MTGVLDGDIIFRGGRAYESQAQLGHGGYVAQGVVAGDGLSDIVALGLRDGGTIYLAFAILLVIPEALTLAWILRRRVTDLRNGDGDPGSRAAVVSRGLGFLKNSMGNLAFSRLDILLLAFIFSTEQLGNYALASRVALIGTVGSRVLVVHFSPRFARRFAEGGLPAARSELRQSLPISFAIAAGLFVPAVAALYLLSGSLFGEFTQTRVPMLVLLGAHLVGTALAPFDTFLSMTGRHHLMGNITLFYALLLLPLLVAGAYVAGVAGGAIAVATAMVAMRLTTAWIATR